MRCSRLIWPVVALLIMGAVVFAQGKLKTHWGVLQAGENGTIKINGECPENEPGATLMIHYMIKNQNGEVVAFGTHFGQGNYAEAIVGLPGGLLHEGDDLTAEIELVQEVGEGDDAETGATVGPPPPPVGGGD